MLSHLPLVNAWKPATLPKRQSPYISVSLSPYRVVVALCGRGLGLRTFWLGLRVMLLYTYFFWGEKNGAPIVWLGRIVTVLV